MNVAWRIEARPALWLAGLFAISRLGYRAAGVRFDLQPLAVSWQILDPAWLRHDLLASVFYMPGQPPLYNLMLGGVLKAAGHDDVLLAAIFQCLYSGMALASVLLTYALMRRLGLARAAAFAAALVFMLTPALILYESIPYYTLPVLLLLVLIVFLFHACVHRFSRWRALALFCAMAALIYTRSLFQWEWFVVLAGFCVLVLPGHRRRVVMVAAVPLALVLALYGKNMAITGHFATSDWLGMSLSKLSTLRIGHAERQRMVEQGTLSPMALNDNAFDVPEAYPDYFAATPATGIAVLDTKRKASRAINYNHLAYARVSERAFDDALAAIRTHPATYLRSIGTAWLISMRPASDYPYLQANRDTIGAWSRTFAHALAGQPTYPQKPGFDLHYDQIGYLIALGYTLAVIFGLWLLVRCALRRRVSAADAALIFIWLNIMYVSVIGNALEMGENQRFRFALNPLIATVVVVMAQRIWYRLRGLRAAKPRSHGSRTRMRRTLNGRSGTIR